MTQNKLIIEELYKTRKNLFDQMNIWHVIICHARGRGFVTFVCHRTDD